MTNMGRFVILAFLAAVVQVEFTSGQLGSVGSCDLTAFAGGGQKCQRAMIRELKNNSNTNCSFEHGKESTCLSDHVASCVATGDPLNAVKGGISRLLLLLLYHCGNLNYNVREINPIILNVVKCDADELSTIMTCFDDFRVTFQANSSDSSLCRKYAEAKQNCANIARQACSGICEYIPKDEYNPFCSNHTDPPGTSELFDCIRDLGCPINVVFEEGKKCDKLGFKNYLEGPQDCGTMRSKKIDCLRNNLVSKCPAMDKKVQVFTDVVKVLDTTQISDRFFGCSQGLLNSELLHRSVKALANCKPEFLTGAKECAESFNKSYVAAPTKKSSGVCSAFSDAKKCLNKEVQDNCEFNEETKKAVMFDEENPFCESGKDPLKSGAYSASAVAGLFLFICSIAVVFVI